ncbi:hypothetical protein HGM15179_016647 [Zosterops borbonicus]|uniref:Rho-GAP domain-containing protein n=1 Tax=Zosterops borbonicus TaxID=364589 RepID=A0A8K1LE18_9PASS|nr:hypothetical protein HGM15179_016647 [Zosterops borbonicus]
MACNFAEEQDGPGHKLLLLQVGSSTAQGHVARAACAAEGDTFLLLCGKVLSSNEAERGHGSELQPKDQGEAPSPSGGTGGRQASVRACMSSCLCPIPVPGDMAGQLVLLLVVILKDFLRSIPAKLLITDLYEDWMAAVQMSSREAKISQLKGDLVKLSAASLLLLEQLLALVQHISQHASTSHITCGNLAICLGPKLLSPLQEKHLELQAMLAENDEVKVLVDFMLGNTDDIFGKETAGLEESPAPTEICTDLFWEEQSGSAGRADEEPQAK